MPKDKLRNKKYFEVFSDSRLLANCVYCGNQVEDRDHVPPKIFLNEPYPESLDVLNSCRKCNGGHSKDEEYVACAIEIAKQGTLEIDRLRKKISSALSYQVKLYEAFKLDVVSSEPFELRVDIDRFKNVFQKLARGHAAHELSYFDFNQNCKISWSTLDLMSEYEIDSFLEPPLLDLLPELGSRGMQRAFENGRYVWVHLQDEQYSYMAFEQSDGITIRILISNYLAVKAFFDNS